MSTPDANKTRSLVCSGLKGSLAQFSFFFFFFPFLVSSFLSLLLSFLLIYMYVWMYTIYRVICHFTSPLRYRVLGLYASRIYRHPRHRESVG